MRVESQSPERAYHRGSDLQYCAGLLAGSIPAAGLSGRVEFVEFDSVYTGCGVSTRLGDKGNVLQISNLREIESGKEYDTK